MDSRFLPFPEDLEGSRATNGSAGPLTDGRWPPKTRESSKNRPKIDCPHDLDAERLLNFLERVGKRSAIAPVATGPVRSRSGTLTLSPRPAGG